LMPFRYFHHYIDLQKLPFTFHIAYAARARLLLFNVSRAFPRLYKSS
jgi:hypothetical protein